MSNRLFQSYGYLYQDLSKGGPGSGVRGHVTLKPDSYREHYSDTDTLKHFKNILRKYGAEAHGKIAYDKKNDRIIVLDRDWVYEKVKNAPKKDQ